MKGANTTQATNPIKHVIFVLALVAFLISSAGQHAAWSQEQPAFTTIHDAFAQVGMRVPAFGGMFVDEKKDTVFVYMVAGQPGDVADLDRAITAVFGANRPTQHHLQAVEGQYTFLELRNWNDHLRQLVLPMPGVVLTGIDEAKNRLSVGLRTPADAAAVEAELAVLGIPREAVNIEYVGPLEEQGSITDRIRPLYGGLRIQKDMGNRGGSTLGVIAIRQGVPGFVTCSHCANTPYQNTGTIFSQSRNTSPDTTRVGMETVNPELMAGIQCGESDLCPDGAKCRCSDTLFARVFNAADANMLGYIVRPDLDESTWPGGNDPPPTFKIVAKGKFLFAGESVTKVGWGSGRTQGEIKSTCRDVQIGGDKTRQLLCMATADYTCSGGDSGSPVFHISDTQNNEVSLEGIHHGVLTASGLCVFSTIGLIQDSTTELGPLIVCADESC